MNSSEYTSIINKRMIFAGVPNFFNSIYHSNTANNSYSIIADRRIGAQEIIVNGAEVLPAVLPPMIAPPIQLPTIYDMFLECFENMLEYIAKVNLGPTRSSRLMYIWFMSVCTGWNWIQRTSNISGVRDNWNWDTHYHIGNNSDTGKTEWCALVFDHIMTVFISDYVPRYVKQFSADTIIAVKATGRWALWVSTWSLWYSQRAADGSSSATIPPSDNVLPNGSRSITVATAVDDPNAFAAPEKWTPLIVQGRRQKYMTYNWGDIVSSCISSAELATIEALASSFFPNTAERAAEIEDVIGITGELTDEQKIIAEFWAGGPGTISPPCMFLWFWKEYVRYFRPSLDVLFYSGLDLAIHLFEGGRIIWHLKKKYMQDRPIQEVRRTKRGSILKSWDGSDILGELWTPYQESNFVTPPFADFPSGHSYFSKAFALTMEAWFGESVPRTDIITCDDLHLISPMFNGDQRNRFAVFTVKTGTSAIQSGTVPSQDTTLSWKKWSDIADSAGRSRFYGGIHCLSAHTSSQAVAGAVDAVIRDVWGILPK
jgi:hypothetical protein